jgi:tetratricopeptide (TPR) repeat protein
MSVADEVKAAVGPQRAEKVQQRLGMATTAFRRGRYEEARKTLRPLAESAPGSPAIRELYGLTLYRLGRWKQAAKELEAWRGMTGEVEQHPVLADCYRAVGRHTEVEELWNELRTTGAEPTVMAEGRIVAAGSLADQGRLKDGIALLQSAVKPVRKAKDHHVRMAYALADLYERAGEAPRAREMFQRVAASDPDFVDVQQRLRALD